MERRVFPAGLTRLGFLPSRSRPGERLHTAENCHSFLGIPGIPEPAQVAAGGPPTAHARVCGQPPRLWEQPGQSSHGFPPPHPRLTTPSPPPPPPPTPGKCVVLPWAGWRPPSRQTPGPRSVRACHPSRGSPPLRLRSTVARPSVPLQPPSCHHGAPAGGTPTAGPAHTGAADRSRREGRRAEMERGTGDLEGRKDGRRDVRREGGWERGRQ